MHHPKTPQSPPGGQTKYIQDYSKALQKEIRILMEEVGKLRDERRSLEYEIAELMQLKNKHSAGLEYTHPWMFQIPPGPDAPPPLAFLEDGLPPEPKPSGWRVVHKRPERKSRKAIKGGGPQPTPTPPPMGLTPPPPIPELPAWQNWRPNPLLAPPTPVPAAAPVPTGPPTKQGLFGDVD